MGGFRREVHCDKCKRTIAIDQRTESTPEGGERAFFDCPYCGTRYPVIEVSKKGLAARTALVGIRARIRTMNRQPRTAEVVAGLLALQEEFASYRDMLEKETISQAGG